MENPKWVDELAALGMDCAGVVFWDGENRIALVCDPEMSEEKRKELASKLALFAPHLPKEDVEELLARIKAVSD